MAIVTSNDYGVILTDGALNTKGAWSEVIAAADVVEDVCLLKISIDNASTLATQYLIDIGKGGAGSEIVIVANIPFASATQFNVGQWSILIPVSLPKGTRVAARCQSNAAGAETVRVQVHAIGGQLNSAVNTTYGSDTSTSAATTIDPGASASTKGAWTELTASSTDTIAWLTVVLSGLGNDARTTATYNLDIGTGGAGSETVVLADLHFKTDTAADDFTCMQFMFPISIAAGTRIAARGWCTINDATDRLFGVSIIGSNVVAGNFGTFITEAEPHWDPEYHYMRPAPARHHQTGGTAWNPIDTPSLPEYQTAPQAHQTELPVRRKPRDIKPEDTIFWNPTPSAPGNVTQAGANIVQSLGESEISQAGVHLIQSPLGVRVSQIGLHIIYIPGPGIPPTPPPTIPAEACPSDDFPIGTGSNRAGCSE